MSKKVYSLGFDDIFLRFKLDNDASILMYADLGYDTMMDDASNDDVIFLIKPVTSIDKKPSSL